MPSTDTITATRDLCVNDRNWHAKFLVYSGFVTSLPPKSILKKEVTAFTFTSANSSSIARTETTMCNTVCGYVGCSTADFLSHCNFLVDFGGHQLINAPTDLTSKGYIVMTPVHSISAGNHANSSAGILAIKYHGIMQDFIDLTQLDGSVA